MSLVNQPRAPQLVTITELWERFGFYTLQTIIVLYMTKALGLPDTQAFLLYGTFGAMLCLSPVLGGYIVERYLGMRRAILIGGVLFIFGYLLIAIAFTLGLALIVIANGLFRPNSGENTSSRWIYLIFLIPPLLTSFFHNGFILAALGMSFGITTFFLARSQLRSFGGLPAMSPLYRKEKVLKFHCLFYLSILLAIGILLFLFQFPGETLILIAIATLSYALFKETSMVISICCFALYSQIFTSLLLYADRNLNIIPEITLIFPPLFALLLTPFLSRFRKSTLAILFIAMGYFLLGIGGSSIYWLMGSCLLQTIGVLLLWRPVSLHAQFLIQASAFAMGGWLATLSSIPDGTAPEAAVKIYKHAFFMNGGIALGVLVLSLLLTPYMKRFAIPR